MSVGSFYVPDGVEKKRNETIIEIIFMHCRQKIVRNWGYWKLLGVSNIRFFFPSPVGVGKQNVHLFSDQSFLYWIALL